MNEHEVIQAAKTLQSYCDLKDCEDCVFKGTDDRLCNISGGNPIWWTIPTPPRFTKDDIALAEILKSTGVVKIYKGEGWAGVMWNNGRNSGFLPTGCFAGLEPGECVTPDDVIGE